MTRDRPPAGAAACPRCGLAGKTVPPVTIESLVTDAARRRIGEVHGLRFCAAPTCDVAYYRPGTGHTVAKAEVLVRIGQKEAGAPRPICYCFHHTIEEIETEVAATGTSRIADDITARCRRGLDRCEETNPQGSCCLGNVRRAMRAAQARFAPQHAAAAASDDPESCCASTADPVPRSPPTGLMATGGAVISAILSSACCWLPLLLLTFGASAAGVAGFFEAYRPYLLGATGLFLATGFYLVYLRKETCGPDETCAVTDPRLRRFNKLMLWVATAVVLAFALFPNYVGDFLGRGTPQASLSASAFGETRVFQIEGMTCAGCANSLELALRRVTGVRRAAVDYEAKQAVVTIDGPADAVLDEITRAVELAGFRTNGIGGENTHASH